MSSTFSIGVHCSHEQWPPESLLAHIKRAQAAGFAHAMCSDHFSPWTPQQGHSGYAWSWLGSALEATTMSCGTVCAPGQRYHPAVIAQAGATMARMYGDRFWVAFGSGEALNEHITGEAWPSKPHRQARLEECVDVIRQLWAGEVVSVRGHIAVDEARVYSRPSRPPLVVGAAVSEQSAAWVAGWADALITVASEPESLRRVVDAFRENGGANKPMFLQSVVVFASEGQGRAIVQREWPQCTLDSDTLADVASAETFEALTRDTSPDATVRCARISDSVDRHIEWLEGDRDLGFDRVYLHDVSRQTPYFAETWGARVLQAFGRP